MLRRKGRGAERIAVWDARSLTLRRRRNLRRDRSQRDTRNHPTPSSSVFGYSDDLKEILQRSGTAIAHLLCRYSLAKHTDMAKNEPLRP